MTARVYHPVRVVTQRTGLSPDLLRAWERRYRVVRPRRSPGGQRLYSEEDIARLKHLHRAVLAGRSISQVARLDREALARLVSEDASPTAPNDLPAAEAAELSRLTTTCLAAVEQLDAPALERALRQAAHRLSVPVLLDHVIAPLLREIGDRWEAGLIAPIHEHAASVEVHRFLTWIVQSTPVTPDAPRIAIATPAGQQMELGALMVAASAAAEGWRVAWFGPNLPANDIVAGVATLQPDALAISLVHQTRDPELHKELERIARGVAGTVPLLVGGRAAQTFSLLLERLGASVFSDLESFRIWLRSHRKA
ncbi:MAG TPA: MerR family transcriptional regulator [Gemmatimonadaceae bacterium]